MAWAGGAGVAHARLAPAAPAVPPSELDYLEDVAVLPRPPPPAAGERAAALVRARSGSLHGSAGAPACLAPAHAAAPAAQPLSAARAAGACLEVPAQELSHGAVSAGAPCIAGRTRQFGMQT